MLIAFLATLLGVIVVFLAVLYGAMWASSKYLHSWAGPAIGAIAFLYLLQNMVSGILYCAQDPIIVPPTPEETAAGSEGKMIANCDGGGGAIDRLYLYIIAPLLLLAIGWLVLRFSKKAVPVQ
ncbi:MAG: hypothetical protein MK098_13735 [Marinovum sp.]|nr:hypothetical protein [Marinovum sp.]